MTFLHSFFETDSLGPSYENRSVLPSKYSANNFLEPEELIEQAIKIDLHDVCLLSCSVRKMKYSFFTPPLVY